MRKCCTCAYTPDCELPTVEYEVCCSTALLAVAWRALLPRHLPAVSPHRICRLRATCPPPTRHLPVAYPSSGPVCHLGSPRVKSYASTALVLVSKCARHSRRAAAAAASRFAAPPVSHAHAPSSVQSAAAPAKPDTCRAARSAPHACRAARSVSPSSSQPR
eukprot:165486-Chlamydomonas_euryale.AAC.1